MPYITSTSRNQIKMMTLENMVASDSEARVIDAFVDYLDLKKLNIRKAVPAREGRPAYNPRDLLKLYIYGAQNDIRSSRKLAKACIVNIEVKWLVGEIQPDFRTISDFRKENSSSMKKVFHAFNRLLQGEFDSEFLSVDGSKFFANNAKERNFTINKLDDRISWLEGHVEEYLRQLDQADQEEEAVPLGALSKEELEARLKEAKERLALYESYRQKMEDENLSQLSLTDADAKLMKMRYGFGVAYNVQTAVSSESHMIADFNVTNDVTDYGQLEPTLKDYKDTYHKDKILEATADKGYQSEEDIARCLEEGIVPHVILPDGKDTYEITLPYEEAQELHPESTDLEELKKCLRSGVIPKAYEGVIESATIKEQMQKVTEAPSAIKTSPFENTLEMKLKALEGYFVRDPERNTVYCPGGNQLRQCYVTKKGRIRYTNKQACRSCPNRERCYKGSKGFQEVEFNKDEFCKPNGNWLKAEGKEVHFNRSTIKREKRKVVLLVLRPDRHKMGQRMCLSEHPFGTIKRAMNGDYFLLQGKQNVEGEFALLALGYNIRRAINHFGFDKLMGLITKAKNTFYSIFKEHEKVKLELPESVKNSLIGPIWCWMA